MSLMGQELYGTQIDAFLDGVVGLSSVDRFHGHSVIANQSVADHSARVAMLAHMIAFEHFDGDISEANAVTVYALFHDFSESILKNDANSSIKNKYGIRELLKTLEVDVVTGIFGKTHIPLENERLGDATRLSNLILECCDKPIQYQILKLADTLDFGLYIWNESMLGNRHIKPLFISFENEIAKYSKELRNLPLVKAIIEKITIEANE